MSNGGFILSRCNWSHCQCCKTWHVFVMGETRVLEEFQHKHGENMETRPPVPRSDRQFPGCSCCEAGALNAETLLHKHKIGIVNKITSTTVVLVILLTILILCFLELLCFGLHMVSFGYNCFLLYFSWRAYLTSKAVSLWDKWSCLNLESSIQWWVFTTQRGICERNKNKNI